MRWSEANKEGGMCDQKILGSKGQNSFQVPGSRILDLGPKTLSAEKKCYHNLQGDHSGCVKPPIDIKKKFRFSMRPMY